MVEAEINDTPPLERTMPVSQTSFVPPGRTVVFRQNKTESNFQSTKKRLSLSFTSGFKDALSISLSAPVGTHPGKEAAVDDLRLHGGPRASNGDVPYEDSQLAGLGREAMSNVYGTLSCSARQRMR